MSASLPYSVVIANNRILPSLNVVGDLDVDGNLTVDGNSRFNSTITDSTGSKGSSGDYLTSNGASLPVSWTSTITVAPVIFFGRSVANQAIPNTTLTQITALTIDVINQGSGFNSATGRFTSPVAGYYNLFGSALISFTGGDGIETNSYIRIFNSLNVLQREYVSQSYSPNTPNFDRVTQSLNINYYLPTGSYATFLVWVQDNTAVANVIIQEGTFFGGSRFTD